MSAESVINEYLKDSNSGSTVTMESLQIYVQEGINVKPLQGVVKFLRQVKNIASINRIFSTNKNMIRQATNKAARAVDEDIFGQAEDVDEKEQQKNNPVNNPAPKDEKEADDYLKKIYLYFKGIIPGLSYPELKQVFKVAVGVVTKLLMGIGIVGSIVLTQGLIIPIAIIITILCILNATEQTKDIKDETERINLKSALKNVLNGFKKMITSLKVDKQQGKFAIISTLIVGVLAWIKYNLSKVEKFFTTMVSFFSTHAGSIFGWLKNVALEPDAVRSILKIAIASNSREEFYNIAKERGFTQEEIEKAESVVKNLWGMSDEQRKAAVKNYVKSQYQEAATKATGMDKWLGKKGAKILWWGLLIVGIATILYLFAEMVDNFNLKKVKEREEDKEEFERTV